jgi:hypothetical protein
MTSPVPSNDYEKLLISLTRELFQTETSAAQHCRREAERLGDTPPAKPLRAVSEHAEAVLRTLPALAEREHLPVSRGGKLTGAFFSELRDKMFDIVTDSERSYRGTLLGTRHGLDAVRMLRCVAEQLGRTALFDFCESWLTTRIVLVERVEEEMIWFAKNPSEALRLARPLLHTARSRLRQPTLS